MMFYFVALSIDFFRLISTNDMVQIKSMIYGCKNINTFKAF